MIIPFRNVKTNIPVIEFTLYEERHWALIDTGSELTLFDSCFEEIGNGVVLYDIDLTGAGGIDKAKASKVNVSMFVKDINGKEKSFEVHGLYVEAGNIFKDTNSVYGEKFKIDAIIGSDTLKSLNAKIDYENGCIVINDLPRK